MARKIAPKARKAGNRPTKKASGPKVQQRSKPATKSGVKPRAKTAAKAARPTGKTKRGQAISKGSQRKATTGKGVRGTAKITSAKAVSKTRRTPTTAATTASKKKSSKTAASPGRAGALTVDRYIADLSGWKAKLVKKLRALMHEASPGSKESIKGGQPVYEVNGPFAFIKVHNTAVNFGFWRGTELNDPARLLQTDDGKMRHVRFDGDGPLPEDALVALIQQAVVLNLAKGDPTRGKTRTQ